MYPTNPLSIIPGTNLRRYVDETGQQYGHLFHYCLGCKTSHALFQEPQYNWGWNGSLDKPSFAHSHKHGPKGSLNLICHYVLTNGILNYCNDSTHELAGKSIPLPPFPQED